MRSVSGTAAIRQPRVSWTCLPCLSRPEPYAPRNSAFLTHSRRFVEPMARLARVVDPLPRCTAGSRGRLQQRPRKTAGGYSSVSGGRSGKRAGPSGWPEESVRPSWNDCGVLRRTTATGHPLAEAGDFATRLERELDRNPQTETVRRKPKAGADPDPTVATAGGRSRLTDRRGESHLKPWKKR